MRFELNVANMGALQHVVTICPSCNQLHWWNPNTLALTIERPPPELARAETLKFNAR